MRLTTFHLAAVAMAALTGCHGGPGSPSGGGGPRGDAISIGAGSMVYGFVSTTTRAPTQVDAFAIGTRPVTRAQYAACVAAGGCAAPTSRYLRCAGDGAGDPNEPAACLTPAQAATYCAWTGGALPTPEQWVYAARGATVRSYPWGESSPGCDQHPDAIGCEAVPDRTRVVGAHPKGASPFGVQDVLLTSRELVRGAQGSAEPACGADGSFCAAAALVSPGRIDMVVPLAAPGDGTTTDSDVFGFRCAWEEK